MKVALVYDRVNKIGGAERVLLALHEIWPEAPLFCSVYQPKNAPWAKNFKKVIPSFLQKIPFSKSSHEFFPWLTPFAFSRFNFADYEVVISITSAEAKTINTSSSQLHICYCLTPTRYLWSGYRDYWQKPGFGSLDFLARSFFWLMAPILRLQDMSSAQKPDYFLAISQTVQKRIKKYYCRESEVIYPPVSLIKFKKNKRFKRKDSFFLVVSRLVPYKNVDLVVQAFNDLRWPLKIIGTGNQLTFLKSFAKKNIEFLEKVDDVKLSDYYQNCEALIMAAEEDFGLVALEAQAAGKPVIAYKRGGALETVINGKTGLFFEELKVEDLKLALNKFKRLKFKPSVCREHAQNFSKSLFIKKFKAFVEAKWQRFKKI